METARGAVGAKPDQFESCSGAATPNTENGPSHSNLMLRPEGLQAEVSTPAVSPDPSRSTEIKEGANGPFFSVNSLHYFFLAAFFGAAFFAALAAFEALKLMDFEAAILMGAPVWGLRPVRALRDFWLKVPKPTSVTLSPLPTWPAMDSRKQPMAAAAAALVMSAVLATASTSSALVRFSAMLLASCMKAPTGAELCAAWILPQI